PLLAVMADFCGARCERPDLLGHWLRAHGRPRGPRQRALFGYRPPTERGTPRQFPRRSRLSNPRCGHARLRAGTAQTHGLLVGPPPGHVGTGPGEIRARDRGRAGDELIGDPDEGREAAEFGMLKPD